MSKLGQKAPLTQILATIPEAGRRLTEAFGMPVRSPKILAMLAEGQLDSVTLGKERFIPIASIDRLIDVVMDQRVRRVEPAADKAPATAAAK